MENYEVTETEVTDVTTEPECETETYYENRVISAKDAIKIGAVTLVGAAALKWLGKKLKPVFVKKAAKFCKKNGYTVVANEVLDAEVEESVQETYEVEED